MSAIPLTELSKSPLEDLSDQALLNEFGELVRQDHQRVASLLRHIDVIDRRKLWARRGHPSLFDFLVSRYHMSESTAGKRIGAARTARHFPILFTMVERGEIHLSGIHCLKAHLTPENHEHVLASAKHQTMRQLEELVARIAPRPDVPSTLRALPQRRDIVATTAPATTPGQPAEGPASPTTTPAQSALNSAVPAPSTAPGSPSPAAPMTPGKRPPRSPDPAPLSPGRYKLQITLGQAAKDKLKQLQDLLAHQIPNGDPAVIVERALEALLTQVHKRKTGITAKPRADQSAAVPSSESRASSSGSNGDSSPDSSSESSPDSSSESRGDPKGNSSPDSSSDSNGNSSSASSSDSNGNSSS
ncbi:MAG TPA: hypothetical protein VFU02_02480, partial [Polyangiaceae bacterium]|nr:hypothetical protein [Polyangiaceae bacterium]